MPVWWSLLLCVLLFAAGVVVGGIVAYVRTSCRYMRLLREQHRAYLAALTGYRSVREEEEPHV